MTPQPVNLDRSPWRRNAREIVVDTGEAAILLAPCAIALTLQIVDLVVSLVLGD